MYAQGSASQTGLGRRKGSVWKQDDFQESSFNKVVGPATRLGRIKREAWRPEAGSRCRELVGKCDERKEETKLMASCTPHPTPRRWEARWMSEAGG